MGSRGVQWAAGIDRVRAGTGRKSASTLRTKATNTQKRGKRRRRTGRKYLANNDAEEERDKRNTCETRVLRLIVKATPRHHENSCLGFLDPTPQPSDTAASNTTGDDSLTSRGSTPRQEKSTQTSFTKKQVNNTHQQTRRYTSHPINLHHTLRKGTTPNTEPKRVVLTWHKIAE